LNGKSANQLRWKCHAAQNYIFNMKTASQKLKITQMREYLGTYIYPIKPSAAFPKLVRLSL
jgi:hypothetical protein